jgi:hypothetical protein
MNSKSLARIAIMLAALTTLWCCSSSDDDNDNNEKDKKFKLSYVQTPVDTAPEWNIDWSYEDPVPHWEAPNATNYESWVVFMVKLEPFLAEQVNEQDMMAVFIDSELRALSLPSRNQGGQIKDEDGNVYYILKVFGNETSGKTVTFTIKYYSNHLHQLFSLDVEEKFVAEKVYGVVEDFEPPFLSGSSKYPISSDIELSAVYDASSDIIPSVNDFVGVFVGDECRGVYSLSDGLLTSPVTFTVYGRKEGENAQIRYYSSKQKAVLTFSNPIRLKSGTQKIILNI